MAKNNPIRASYFIAHLEGDFTTYIAIGDTYSNVEKSAIDFIANQREQGIEDQTVIIYKVYVAKPSDRVRVSMVYLDKITKRTFILCR